MAYATRADLVARFGEDEISQRESMLPDGAAVTLAEADALIDGYVGGRYSLPLSPLPPNMLQVACVIARYNLLGEAATERARNDYKDAIAWLKDVAAGHVSLQAAAPLAGAAPAATVLMTSAEAVFKRAGRP